MSDHNKHIDRIFQESFKNFEAQPSDAVWKKIQRQVQPKKNRLLPIWFKYAGIAASLVLAFGLGYWLQPNPTNQAASFTNLNEDDAKIELQTELSTNFESANQLLDQLINQTAFLTENPVLSETSVISASKASKEQKLQTEEMASTKTASFNLVDDASDENDYAFLADISTVLNEVFQTNYNTFNKISNEITSTEDKITSAKQDEENKKQFDEFFEDTGVVESTSIKKWFLKPVLSPIFNSGNNASSALGQEVANNASSGDVSFSYGMQVGFKINNKWSIRTGINQVNTSYTTENVVYAPSASAFMPENVSAVHGLYGQDYYSTNLASGNNRIFSQEGSLSQQMNFVEIPLEVEYAVLDGKFGISLTGGASTFLLTDNGLLMSTSNGNINIGEAQNLNQTSFSTNVGLGLNYQLSKKLKFNVEPALKYQINTFRGSNLDFNPYFFGVYSGLQFQF